MFIDRPNRTAYRLVAPPARAMIASQGGMLDRRPDPSASRAVAAARAENEEEFLGISCIAGPIEVNSFDSMTLSGRSCYSVEYDLLLHSVLDQTAEESGLTIRRMQEFYEPELGRAPDPAEVRIPAGFASP